MKKGKWVYVKDKRGNMKYRVRIVYLKYKPQLEIQARFMGSWFYEATI